jgi:ABC-2 type transport system ATP-binding protein
VNSSNPVFAIETHGLTRRFGAKAAVDGIDLNVNSGGIFGLLGPNGAGKTTTIRMLTTLLPVSAGEARVGGFDIRHHAAQVREHIGYVPQTLSADSDLTGYENLLIFGKLYRVPARERAPRIAEAMEFMGITEAANQLVRHYSGGMIRRLEIAQSLVNRPDILFLDEPSIGLDPAARHAVWDRIQALQKKWNTTVFMTTHYMDEAEILCQEVAFILRGRLVAQGTPASLKAELGRDATLDDVFIHLSGGLGETEDNFRNVARERQSIQRHG